MGISEIVGVLGFLLSLGLAILRLKDACMSVSLSDVRVHHGVVCLAKEGRKTHPLFLKMKATISNKSSCHIAVVAFSTGYRKEPLARSRLFRKKPVPPLYPAGFPFPGFCIEGSASSWLDTPTPLPVNLPPHYSQQIDLVFHIHADNELRAYLEPFLAQWQEGSNRACQSRNPAESMAEYSGPSLPLVVQFQSPYKAVLRDISAVYVGIDKIS